MLSKNNIKFINSLKKKKYRSLHEQFIIEGEKIITEAIHLNVGINQIIATEKYLSNIQTKISDGISVIEASENELKKISSLSAPNQALAILDIPKFKLNKAHVRNSLSIAIENIQDPGNLGTIIRTADWFGIKNVICSENSVDVYNPKVVQSTMGAIFRVNVHYIDLDNFFHTYSDVPVYGTFLTGNNIYKEKLGTIGVILFGNESRGISKNLEQYVKVKLTIPNFGESANSSESLNVSSSVAIVCSEFKR